MPCKLLLVDDSVTIRRVVELTFAGEDVNVVAVGDGREAMERIVSERPDIVLADGGPGEPDGYEVARFVKRHPALSHVPVVLLTGAFEPVDRVRAAECGCDGVLAKPFDLQSMVGVVRGLLHRPAGDASADAVPRVLVDTAPAAPAAAAAASASSDGNGDAGAASLIDWWASLLQDPAPPEPAALPAIPVTVASSDPARPAPRPAVSLDDYFDLVDDLLAQQENGSSRPSSIPPFRPS